jgi:hypothetical protein
MNPYQQVLELAREQADAARRGDLEEAAGALDRRADLLADAAAPSASDVSAIQEILTLDREVSAAIRMRMIEIRNEAAEGQHGRRALEGYSRRQTGDALALDELS